MSIVGWHVLPMGESELPTMYLQRFRVWVNEQINERASEILQGR
jgi:hypothetical protein